MKNQTTARLNKSNKLFEACFHLARLGHSRQTKTVVTQKILLAIPAYRCEKQIRRVIIGLEKVRARLSLVDRVVIFDNQSPDDTVAEARAQIVQANLEAWIEVQINPLNLGLGGTHKKAFELAHRESYTHIIIFHGDDQGDVNEIPKIIEGFQRDFAAVLGSRFMTGSSRLGYSKIRILGNRVLNLIYSVLTRQRIEDLGSGLNGFRVAELQATSYMNFSNQFSFNMDLLLSLVDSKAKIEFVPISWREIDQLSNARSFRVGWQALMAVLRWKMNSLQRSRQLSA